MTRKNITVAVCTVVAISLIIWFVMPNQEEKAKAQLDAAYQVEQSGQLEQALSLYENLIKDYQGTEAANSAGGSIERVKRARERILIQNEKKNLERIALVLNGYREMFGMMPASIQQLDSDAYMFDSDYIAEIPPAGFTYYLRFEPETSSYVLFSLKDGSEKAIRYEASGKTSVINAALLDQEISQGGHEKITKGRMVFLQPTKQ